MAAPNHEQVSEAAVKAFAFLVANPGHWHSVRQIAEAIGVSKNSVQSRLATLARLGALRSTMALGPRCYMLCEHWPFCDLAASLHEAAQRATK